MSKKLTKAELTAALNKADVPFPSSATVSQMLRLYESECLQEDAADEVNAEDITCKDDSDLDGMLASLEKKRKVLALQKEIGLLEKELSNGIQTLSITDVDNIVPKFTGDDAYSIEKWISDFENTMMASKCNAHFKYMSARRLLGGTAAIFLRTSSARTYDELKAGLLEQFQRRVSTRDVYRELQNRCRLPKENILAYMFAMVEIAAQAELEEKEVINATIEGLRDKSAHTSVLYTFRNMEEFKHLLLIYDKRRPDITLADRKENKAVEPVCYNCSRRGHISSKCTQPKRMIGSCFRCGNRDHQIKDCPRKTANVVTHVIDCEGAFPIECEQKVGVAFCNRNVNNMNFIEQFSLIDSGSPISLVCKRLLPFDISNDFEVASPFSGVGGPQIKTYGQIEGDISLNNKIKKITFYVVADDLIRRPLLLGRNSFSSFNIQLCIFPDEDDIELKNMKSKHESNVCKHIVHIPKIFSKNAHHKCCSGVSGGAVRPKELKKNDESVIEINCTCFNDIESEKIDKDNDQVVRSDSFSYDAFRLHNAGSEATENSGPSVTDEIDKNQCIASVCPVYNNLENKVESSRNSQ